MVSYWKIFRLIFVLFSLYLLRDIFYRWDGFKYYGSFSEFLPSVALATILWSSMVMFITLLAWFSGKMAGWFCKRMGREFKTEHLLLFISAFLLLGIAAWKGKLLILGKVQTSPQLKLIVFLCVILIAIFPTWLFRNKAERWMGLIQKHITPLVWLFGSCVVFFVPLLIYHMQEKPEDNLIPSKIALSYGSNKSRPNIILVTFDSLTARDMSLYGYHRPTTPFITEWAKRASIFTRVEAESNWTPPTTASLMTGKRVWTHQKYHERGLKPLNADIESLPLVLKNNGYYTMAFVQNPVASVKQLGISNSFKIAPIETEFMNPASLFGPGWVFGYIDILFYRLFSDKILLYDWILRADFVLGRLLDSTFSKDFSKTTVPPEKVFNRFLLILNDNPPEPYFAWIHIFPPHDPYLPPHQYMGMFDPSPSLKTIKNQWKIAKHKHFPKEMQPTINLMRARYDEFIRYCDKQFENFIKQLIKRNKLKNTVIILSSDHGESFEHNYLGHRGTLYEPETHIPLIIKEPGQTEGQIINEIVEQIDIPATILELAHIPIPSWMEGRSLVPLMRGKKLSSKPAFSMYLEKNPGRGVITRGIIAVWEDEYKLIYDLDKKRPQLFNIKKDPDELKNLFDINPEIGKRLLTIIQNNLKQANERIRR
jgi:arylsulfatase A-like enzyme